MKPQPVVATTRKARGRGWYRLPPAWRKLLLTVHVTVSVGLLGCDAAVLTLVLAGARGAVPAGVYPAAHLLADVLLVPLALAALVTGVALGLLTQWELMRYWWVAAKLILTVGGVLLGLFVLTPALAAAADVAGSLTAGGAPAVDRAGLVKDTTGATSVLLVTVVLSVFKPFGRLRRPRPEALRRVAAGPGNAAPDR